MITFNTYLKHLPELHDLSTTPFPLILLVPGVCPVEEDAAPMMILELMPYGDLHFFLQANRLVTYHPRVCVRACARVCMVV